MLLFPATLMNTGPVVEAPIVNLAEQPSAFGTSPWAANGTADVTENTATGPDGLTTADTITFGSDPSDQRFQPAPDLSAISYTLDVWAKVASGTKAFRLKLWDGFTNYYSTDLTATTTGQRLSFQITPAAGGTGPNMAVTNDSAGTPGDLIVADFRFYETP